MDINQIENLRFVKLIVTEKSLSKKAIVHLDYGQETEWTQPPVIRGEGNKDKSFKTGIAALNFMIENGWEYVDSHLISSRNPLIIHYLLRRKK